MNIKSPALANCHVCYMPAVKGPRCHSCASANASARKPGDIAKRRRIAALHTAALRVFAPFVK